MKLTFFAGAKTVTGANYLLEIGSKKVLIDCGMLQGVDFVETFNYQPFPYDPASIDYVFLTHAHIDHVGRVPKLVREGFKGKIIATAPTVELAKLALRDSVHIIEQESRELEKDPYYTMDDVQKTDKFWVKHNYHEVIDLGEGLSVQLLSAGHVLGSTMYRFVNEQTSVTFTGDLGNDPSPLIGPAEDISETDYLVMEAVYGDRDHDPAKIGSKLLKEIIEETIGRGGTLLIPSFALERTQVLLYYLNNMIEQGKIPQVPVFVDSPLAIKMTNVFSKQIQYFRKELVTQVNGGDKIFEFPGLRFTETVEESKAINNHKGPKIIIAGNGMSTAGRILHHEKFNLSDPKNTVLIVGYQVKNSLGRQLLDGKKKVRIHRKEVEVRADVHQITAFSAHADKRQLIDFVTQKVHNKPKRIFIVQGEENAAEHLAFELDQRGYNAYVPNYKEIFELS